MADVNAALSSNLQIAFDDIPQVGIGIELSPVLRSERL